MPQSSPAHTQTLVVVHLTRATPGPKEMRLSQVGLAPVTWITCCAASHSAGKYLIPTSVYTSYADVQIILWLVWLIYTGISCSSMCSILPHRQTVPISLKMCWSMPCACHMTQSFLWYMTLVWCCTYGQVYCGARENQTDRATMKEMIRERTFSKMV